MTINWPSIAIGAVLGGLLSILVNWQIGPRLRKWSEHRALTKEYGSLTGEYANFEIAGDETLKSTAGKILLTWQHKDGLFKVKALHGNGNVDWESDFKMSMELKGTGAGRFRHVGTEGSGTQVVIYSPETRSFNVMGTMITGKVFGHRWKLIER